TAPPSPAPPAKPTTDLPALTGPLEVQVLDADSKTVLDRRRITVDIASPWEYVQIAELQFAPASKANGRLNRLMATVKALPAFSGPPCAVEMVLPADRIPGFGGLQGGT